MLVSRGGPTMLARIGVMKALNRRTGVQFRSQRSSLGQAQAEERPMTVFVYVNTSKQVGDPEHIRVFATTNLVRGKRPRRRGVRI